MMKKNDNNNVNNNQNNNSCNNKNQNSSNKKNHQAYETLATAEKAKMEKKTNTSRPSDTQVENMRDFSIENKK